MIIGEFMPFFAECQSINDNVQLSLCLLDHLLGIDLLSSLMSRVENWLILFHQIFSAVPVDSTTNDVEVHYCIEFSNKLP